MIDAGNVPCYTLFLRQVLMGRLLAVVELVNYDFGLVISKFVKKIDFLLVCFHLLHSGVLILEICCILLHIGPLYLSVTPKFYTKVLHQALNPAAEFWCKTLSRIVFGVKCRFKLKFGVNTLSLLSPTCSFKLSFNFVNVYTRASLVNLDLC